MSSISLPIAIVGGSGKGQLKVEGTVLVYSRKTWFFESTLLIPVESARMSEHPRFHKDLSILAFLIPVITIVLAVALVLCTRVANIEGLNREVLIVVSATAIFVIVLLELWLLFGYLMSFLFTKNSICLTFGDGNMQIEFWKTKKVARLMDSFEKVIREKQTRIQESTLKPSTEVFEIYNVNHIRSSILLSCFLCIPSLSLHVPVLLFLGLIPIGWHVFKSLRLLKHPKEYRKAVRRYRRKDWDGAILHLKSLLERAPEYVPAKLLLIEIYVRAERFNEALQMAGNIPDEYLDDSNALYLEIWRWKRVHLRRKEPMSDVEDQHCL
jgi:hypothetical protein